MGNGWLIINGTLVSRIKPIEPTKVEDMNFIKNIRIPIQSEVSNDLKEHQMRFIDVDIENLHFTMGLEFVDNDIYINIFPKNNY